MAQTSSQPIGTPATCSVPPAGGASEPTQLDPPRSPFRAKLRELFGLDLRSMALFRVALALQILVELACQSRSLRAFYTDFGVLPRVDVLNELGNQMSFSVYLVTGSTFFVACLFVIQALLAVALLVGFRTRLATILSWFMLASLQGRNPEVVQGGDVLFRQLLFWSCFLPLGACYSVDSATDHPPDRPPDLAAPASSPPARPLFLSGGTFALIMQVVMVYWFAALFKRSDAWWHGEAVRRALMIDIYVAPLGERLLQWGAVLPYLTWAALAMESLGPFLAFSPFFTGPLRLLCVIVFICFHLTMGLFLELGIFRTIAIVGWLVFLPPCFWEWLMPRLRTAPRTGLRIYYDGDCAFCRRMVLLIRTFLLLPETPLLPAQSEPPIDAAMRQHNSWVVVDHAGKQHVKFEALAYVVSTSPLLGWGAALLRLRPVAALGERCYEAVANNRSRADRWTKRLTPRPPRLQSSWLGSGFALLVLAIVVVWNIRALDVDHYVKYFPARWNWVGFALRTDQCWDMFAPQPLPMTGWFVIDAHLRDGQRIDLWRKQPVTYDRPAWVADTYVDAYWRKYLENIAVGSFPNQASHFTRWLCRDWNTHHASEQRVRTCSVYFMRQIISLSGKTEPERMLKWHEVCPDTDAAE